MPRKSALDGRVALITGAASGIGAATARRFAREGAHLALLDRRRAPLERLARELRAQGGPALSLHADVSDEQAVRRAVGEASRRLGGLDSLVLNAGICGPAKLVTELSAAEFNEVLATNLLGIFYVAKHGIPHLVARGGGTIVTVASELGLIAAPQHAAYGAAKAAVIALTRTIALEYHEQGIRANCVAPGPIETPLLEEFFQKEGQPERQRSAELAQVPMGRFGRPEEVAEAILFFAADPKGFTTGSVLVVDGGMLAI